MSRYSASNRRSTPRGSLLAAVAMLALSVWAFALCHRAWVARSALDAGRVCSSAVTDPRAADCLVLQPAVLGSAQAEGSPGHHLLRADWAVYDREGGRVGTLVLNGLGSQVHRGDVVTAATYDGRVIGVNDAGVRVIAAGEGTNGVAVDLIGALGALSWSLMSLVQAVAGARRVGWSGSLADAKGMARTGLVLLMSVSLALVLAWFAAFLCALPWLPSLVVGVFAGAMIGFVSIMSRRMQADIDAAEAEAAADPAKA